MSAIVAESPTTGEDILAADTETASDCGSSGLIFIRFGRKLALGLGSHELRMLGPHKRWSLSGTRAAVMLEDESCAQRGGA